MRVLDPGHMYELNCLDGDGVVSLQFVKREGNKYPGNVGHYQGTNIQEVLRVLIDRVEYLNSQEPDFRNGYILADFRRAILWLEHRAAERHGRNIDGLLFDMMDNIELLSTCRKCGHIGCNGECHE